MNKEEIKDTVLAITLGLLMTFVVMPVVLTVASAASEYKRLKHEYNRKIKLGLENGTIVKIGNKYYEVSKEESTEK